MRKNIIFFVIISLVIGGCCKDKNTCIGNYTVTPFIEKSFIFECNNNDEYTYIFSKKSQIDSLQPTCSFNRGVVFPLDELNMKYIIIGRHSNFRRDTFQTSIVKDSCLKILTYNVNMLQRDTARTSFFPTLGVLSMYCAVENIPADYKVEVKYKYVPLP